MANEIDAAAFEKAFQDALPGHAATFKAKADDAAKTGGMSPDTASFAGIGDLQTTFCSAWPTVRSFLLMAIKAFGWVLPAQAAQARAVITAIQQTVVPVLCKKPAA